MKCFGAREKESATKKRSVEKKEQVKTSLLLLYTVRNVLFLGCDESEMIVPDDVVVLFAASSCVVRVSPTD